MADHTANGADTDAGAPASDPQQAPVALFRDWLLLVPLLGVIALDQATKQIVKSNLNLYEAWPAEGFFRIVYRTNSGTAFGLFPGQTVTLILLSVFAVGFLFYFYRTRALSYPMLRLAIGLQLGGAIGNLIDRLRHGAVVDFIDVGPWAHLQRRRLVDRRRDIAPRRHARLLGRSQGRRARGGGKS